MTNGPEKNVLDETRVDSDPLAQFRRWYADTEDAGTIERTAMTLATVSPEGRPSARIVLLKEIDEQGFVFYTNRLSRKGRELEHNPWCALVLWWGWLGRQVRIEGRVERVPEAVSEAYFSGRPRESQIGALASSQSEVIADRAALEAQFRQIEQQYHGRDVPRPPHWGGYRVIPEMVEFWVDRPGRMHDRLCYRREGDRWRIERLAP